MDFRQTIITDFLTHVRLNPENLERDRRTWKDYELIESNPHEAGRREMTWKQFDDRANKTANLLLTRGVKKGDKIAIIGSGDLFDEIMKKALLMNIFAPDQGIEYHLWNPSERFMTAHPELDNIAASAKDKIVYHGGDFIKDHEMMRSMNRLIFCGAEKDNITDALKLIAIMPLKAVYIYGKNKKGIERLFRSCETTIINFGAAEDTLTFDNVVREKQTETAKQISEHYRIKYGGDTWEYLDVFKRESSLSAAEYFPVIQMLNKKGLSIEELSELEHIRWCRFFWINNWHYNKVRDNSKRLHNCLVPYADLTDAEKAMDTENVELALSKEFTSDS